MGRVFGFLSLVLGLAVGMYFYSRQVQSSAAAGEGATPQATINITGVKTDLMGIAAAERQYYAGEGKYGTLDELISGNYITVARERPPYSYSVEISFGGFRVVATRSEGDTSGMPAQLSVDQNMEFRTSQ